jgi:hypothetical protein
MQQQKTDYGMGGGSNHAQEMNIALHITRKVWVMVNNKVRVRNR